MPPSPLLSGSFLVRLLWMSLALPFFFHSSIKGQGCRDSVVGIYQKGLTDLSSSIAEQESSEADRLLKKGVAILLEIENYSPAACTSPSFDSLRGEYLYRSAMILIGVLQHPEWYPYLDRELVSDRIIELLQASRRTFQHWEGIFPGHYFLFRTFVNQGKTLAILKNNLEARKSLEDGLALAASYQGSPIDSLYRLYMGDLLRESGQQASSMGDYQVGINYLFQALPYYQANKDQYYSTATYYQMAKNYNQLLDAEQTLRYVAKVRAQPMMQDPNYQTWYMDACLFAAYARGLQGKVADAESEIDKLLDLNQVSPLYRAEARGLLGIIQFENKAYEAAYSNLRESIELYEKLSGQNLKERFAFLQKYQYLARTLVELDRKKEALAYLDRALGLAVVHEEGPLLVNEQEMALLLGLKGDILRQIALDGDAEPKLGEARDIFEQALHLIDQQRKYFKEEGSKLFLAREAQEVYEGAILTALAMKDDKKALQIAEKSKSKLLAASLREEAARKSSSLPDSLLNREYDLKREIALLDQQLWGLSPEDSLYNRIMARRSEQKNRLNALIDEIEESDPDYFKLKYEDHNLDVAELQSLLPDSSSLIEYFGGKENWVVFVLNKEGLQTFILPRKKKEIQDFSALFPQENFLRDKEEYFEAMAHSLYLDLVQPFEEILQKYLIILPDAELNYLPFDVLFTEPANEKDFPSTYPYWLRKKAISYGFSAQLWTWTQKSSSGLSWLKRNLVVFAPEFNPISPKKLDATERAMMKNRMIYQRPEWRKYPDLPNMSSSQEEALRLAEIPGARIYSPRHRYATLGTFLSEAGKFRVIHLATHGKFDSTNHRYSYLAFRPVDNGIHDDRLYLDDLYRFETGVEMVVLSACETQMGEFFPGEGNASLAQGFTHAGVKSLVATRWSINSEAKAQQMALFYDFLRQGHNKAEAIRLSKLELLSQGSKFPSPYYWAAPIVMGDASSISFLTIWSWYGGLIGGLILISFFVIVAFIRLRTRRS